MKRLINTCIILFAFSMLVCGCQKDELIRYRVEDSAVRFPTGIGNESGTSQYITAEKVFQSTFTFLSVPFGTEYYDYKMPVVLTGLKSDKDREVGVEVKTDGTTAVSGQYEILDASIEANEYIGYITIRIHYDSGLDTEERRLMLQIVDTDDLKAGAVEFIKGRLVWHNMAAKPVGSSYIRSYNYLIAGTAAGTNTSLDYWSPSAQKAILAVLSLWGDPGISLPSYTGAPWYIYSNSAAWCILLNEYLVAYKNTNGDYLRHDAGLFKDKPINARGYDIENN